MLTNTLSLSSKEYQSIPSLIPVAKLSHILGIWILLHSTVWKVLFPMEGDPWKVRVIMPLIHLFLLTSILLKGNHNCIHVWGLIEGFDMCEQFWEIKLIWETHPLSLISVVFCFLFLFLHELSVKVKTMDGGLTDIILITQLGKLILFYWCHHFSPSWILYDTKYTILVKTHCSTTESHRLLNGHPLMHCLVPISTVALSQKRNKIKSLS